MGISKEHQIAAELKSMGYTASLNTGMVHQLVNKYAKKSSLTNSPASAIANELANSPGFTQEMTALHTAQNKPGTPNHNLLIPPPIPSYQYQPDTPKPKPGRKPPTPFNTSPL